MLLLRGSLPLVVLAYGGFGYFLFRNLRSRRDALWLFAGDTWPRNNAALARFTPETAHRRVAEAAA